MRIYLAGPMYGCTDDEAYNWRHKMEAELPEAICVSPNRLPLTEYEAIVDGDLDLVNNSDLVVVNAWKPSWGTAMKAYDAWISDIPIVVIWPFTGGPVHPWLNFIATVVVDNVQGAIMAIRHYVDVRD